MNVRMAHNEDFSFLIGESAEFFSSFISMDPEGSPPRRQECGLYRTTIFCGVQVAFGFLPLARSFTSRGTSSAECRMDKPHTLGFGFRGADRGAIALMGWGLFGERESFPFLSEDATLS